MKKILKMAPSQRIPLTLVTVAWIISSCISHAQTIYFTSSSQLTSNFAIQQASGQTLAVSGSQLDQSGTAAGAVNWVYDIPPDSTPSNASYANFTASLSFTLGVNNNSIGIYFYDGGNRSNSLLALFNVNATGSSDIIRFFSGANIAIPIQAGTQTGTTTTLTSGGYTIGQTYIESLTVADLGSGNIQATLTISDPTNTLSPFSASYTYTGITAVGGEIGFRSSLSAPGTNAFDYVDIVPEPSTLALLGLPIVVGIVHGISRRRRS